MNNKFLCIMSFSCLLSTFFFSYFFFFNDTATTEIYTLSLHDALPIYLRRHGGRAGVRADHGLRAALPRSEEHTSELQSHHDLVCRLLLEKKKKNLESTFSTTGSTNKTTKHEQPTTN